MGGAVMDWQARLTERRQIFQKGLGALPTKLTKPGSVSFGSDPGSPLENIAGHTDTRAHLLTLADADMLPAATVHRLHAGELAACVGQPDETLRAYLRALDRGTVMDAGQVPPGYTQPVRCEGCGPVWLWPGAPATLKGCPWCFRRKAGKAIPRPPVIRDDCTNHDRRQS